MKTLKRIIYILLGLILVGAVGMVGVILYAEYSGNRFSPDSAEALAELDFSDGESRLVYDENGNIAELPNGIVAEDTISDSEAADTTAISSSEAADTATTSVSEVTDATTPTSTDSVATSPTEDAELPYVMDLGSALFHTETCPYAANIAEENRSAMTTTREKVLNAGYTPCSNCNP